MADKFPLVVDGTAIKELPNGDNLELTGSNVVGAGTVALTNLTVGGSQGNDGDVLTSTGSGIAWENISSSDSLPKTGGAMTGAITTNSTFDGRDVATDGTKLDGIEASADVTDAANVTAAGALMDSELTSIASVKALNQGVATSNSPTFAGITTSGITNTANLKISGAQGSDGQILTSTGSGVAWEDAAGGGGGGAWNVMSSQTVTSDVASITFTNVTGYKTYKLVYTDVLNDSTGTAYQLSLSSDNGSSYASIGVKSTAYEQNSTTTSGTITNQYYQSNRLPINKAWNQFNNNEQHHGEVTIYGLNDSSGHTYIHGQMLSSWGWNTNNVAGNEVYARSYGSGSLVAFNAFKITAMADSDHQAGTWTLYGLATS